MGNWYRTGYDEIKTFKPCMGQLSTWRREIGAGWVDVSPRNAAFILGIGMDLVWFAEEVYGNGGSERNRAGEMGAVLARALVADYRAKFEHHEFEGYRTISALLVGMLTLIEDDYAPDGIHDADKRERVEAVGDTIRALMPKASEDEWGTIYRAADWLREALISLSVYGESAGCSIAGEALHAAEIMGTMAADGKRRYDDVLGRTGEALAVWVRDVFGPEIDKAIGHIEEQDAEQDDEDDHDYEDDDYDREDDLDDEEPTAEEIDAMDPTNNFDRGE